jgi:hypothetical protein
MRRELLGRLWAVERCLPVRLAPLFLLAAAALVPWTIYLVKTLPAQHEASHWDVAWVGFDAGLAVTLALVGVTAARRSAWLEGAATAAAALLIIDAWFDVLTAGMGAEVAVAGVEAGLVELPMAAVCLWLARTAKRRIDVAAPLIDVSSTERPAARAVDRARELLDSGRKAA